MIDKLLRYSIPFISLLIIIQACAKIGSPTGGPKDYDPPVLVSSSPANYATHFNGKEIEITFNEFIQLKDVSSKFFVSPPIAKKPNPTVKDKSIIIKLEEDLKPYSTYRFAFGDAVTDNNEGNPIDNFEFVVSTSGIIDSMSLHGQVVSAFDRTPDKDRYFVMLYDQFHDTIPRKQLPSYLTRTNEKGWFSFNNVRPDTFMILALKDGNLNYLFDTPTENIAFSDTLIALENYTFSKDSIVMDTVKIDSMIRVRKVPKPQITMYSFTEDHVKQYLEKSQRPRPNQFDLFFTRPILDSVSLKPLNFSKTDWLIADRPIFNDTLNFWIKDTSLVNKDTLILQLTYNTTDSLGATVAKIDTISLINKKLPSARNTRKGDKAKKVEYVQISNSSTQKPVVDLNSHIILETGTPVTSIDTSKIKVYWEEEDEKGKEGPKKKKKLQFSLQKDSTYLRKYHLKFPFEPNAQYTVIMDSMACTDIYGLMNDSTGFTFKTQKDDFYGKIIFALSNVSDSIIIQLLTEKEDILQQKFIRKDQEVIFDYLAPATYKVKVIYDRNHNKTWDTGNFEKKLQPEKVLYFKDIITVRANWDVTLTWKLE